MARPNGYLGIAVEFAGRVLEQVMSRQAADTASCHCRERIEARIDYLVANHMPLVKSDIIGALDS